MKAKPFTFETESWGPETIELPALSITLDLLEPEPEGNPLRRFHDPLSRALREICNENTCAEVFWNSDSFVPRYPSDDARFGIFIEIYEDGKFQKEMQCWQPLPRSADQAMKRIANHQPWQPTRTRIKIPLLALPPQAQESVSKEQVPKS